MMARNIDFGSVDFTHITIRAESWSDLEAMHFRDMSLPEALALFYGEYDIDELLLITIE